MIKNDLNQAIQRLYEAFSAYARPERMETDGGVVTQEDEPELLGRPLHEIPKQAIEAYAINAMWTWGDVDWWGGSSKELTSTGPSHFKYFLPRILEFLPQGLECGCCPEIVLGKLAYGGWRSWAEGEQAAVECYCRSLWQHVLTTVGWLEAGGYLCGFARIFDDLQWFLTEWVRLLPQSPASAKALLEFCAMDISDDEAGFGSWLDMARSMVGSGQAGRFTLGAFWEERREQERQALTWVFSPATIAALEKACEVHRIESDYDREWTLKQLRGSSKWYFANQAD